MGTENKLTNGRILSKKNLQDSIDKIQVLTKYHTEITKLNLLYSDEMLNEKEILGRKSTSVLHELLRHGFIKKMPRIDGYYINKSQLRIMEAVVKLLKIKY